jgi:hypothetical protein
MPAKIIEREEASNYYYKVLRTFMLSSTVVGLDRLIISPFRLQRIIWASVIFAGICGTIYQLYIMTNRYYQLTGVARIYL